VINGLRRQRGEQRVEIEELKNRNVEQRAEIEELKNKIIEQDATIATQGKEITCPKPRL